MARLSTGGRGGKSGVGNSSTKAMAGTSPRVSVVVYNVQTNHHVMPRKKSQQVAEDELNWLVSPVRQKSIIIIICIGRFGIAPTCPSNGHFIFKRKIRISSFTK